MAENTGACTCGGCGLSFTGLRAFDMHRVTDGATRRCLSVEEMTAKRMTHNQQGRWMTRAFTGGFTRRDSAN